MLITYTIILYTCLCQYATYCFSTFSYIFLPCTHTNVSFHYYLCHITITKTSTGLHSQNSVSLVRWVWNSIKESPSLVLSLQLVMTQHLVTFSGLEFNMRKNPSSVGDGIANISHSYHAWNLTRVILGGNTWRLVRKGHNVVGDGN
jgi:hypothetical protein